MAFQLSTGQIPATEGRQNLSNIARVITITENLCSREHLAIHHLGPEGKDHGSFEESLVAF